MRRLDPDYFRLAWALAFQRGTRPPHESSVSRLERHDAGDVTEFCFWCGLPYVNTGSFPYCCVICAAQARGV